MMQNQQNPGTTTGRALDLLLNVVGVLAILLMLVAVIGNTSWGTTLKIPTTWIEPTRNAGWVCIGLYVVGSLWQSRTWLVQVWKRERTQSGTNLLIQVGLAVTIVGAVNYLGTRNHKRWDLTENKQFSLSEQTRKIVKELPGKVSVTMFVNPGDRSNQQNKELWQEYSYVKSENVSFRAIDADRNPQEVLKFVQSLPKDQQSKVMEGGTIKLGTIILEYKGAITSVTGYNEQDFTSALLKATRGSQKTLYWVEGHGESDPDSYGGDGMGQIKQALEKQNYKIEKLPLLGRQAIPEDATALVIAGAQKPYAPHEIELLKTYVKRGGKVYVLFRSDVDSGLESWLADTYAVIPEKAIVLERDAGYMYRFNPTFPAVVKYPWHSITQSFQNNRLFTVFPLSRAFTIADKKPDGVTVEPLAETSSQAQGMKYKGELNPQALSRPFDDKSDLKGPLKLAVAITLTSKATVSVQPELGASPSAEPLTKEKEIKGRLIAIGSPFFAGNQFAQNFNNGDFFLAGMNWLAEEEALISIPPKSNESRTVELMGQTQTYLGLGTVAFPPLALLLIGGIVWWRRR